MYAVAGVAATGIREYGSDGGCIGEPDGDAVKGGFFRDFLEGWSWSLHRKTLVVVLIVAALVNFGVNGIQYASSCIWCRAEPMRPSSDSSVAAYR